MRIRQLILSIPVAALVIGLPPMPDRTGDSLTLIWNAGAASPAAAHRYHRHRYRPSYRHSYRRHAPRRAVRNVVYRAALPGPCARAAALGHRYWRCGPATYRSVYRDGRRVYVVVPR
ncbi:MAG: hypothetical protein AAF501_22050 [Pseudomonadota bacterium]